MDMEFEVADHEVGDAVNGLRAQGFTAGAAPKRLGDELSVIGVLDVGDDDIEDARSAMRVLTTSFREL